MAGDGSIAAASRRSLRSFKLGGSANFPGQVRRPIIEPIVIAAPRAAQEKWSGRWQTLAVPLGVRSERCAL